jgi:nucleoside-diphosphate-sugar epimerase
MSCVLVTGATGFVGRSAIAALRLRGHEVLGVARTATDDVKVHAWHTANLLDPSAVPKLVRDAHASHLLHLAWTTKHSWFWSDPANLAWARATCGLVDAFAEAGGIRVVMTGSCAQYDWAVEAIGASGLACETVTPRRPVTLYGHAKQATTDLLETWSTETGMSYATALLFFPYGPYEKPERLVPSVTRSLLAGEPALVTAGTQIRDFIHVDDCGAALAALVDSEVTGAVNIGSGQGSSVADVANTIARIIGREDLLRIGTLPSSDEGPRVVASTTRLYNEVGLAPRYDLETGLRDTIEWWRGL